MFVRAAGGRFVHVGEETSCFAVESNSCVAAVEISITGDAYRIWLSIGQSGYPGKREINVTASRVHRPGDDRTSAAVHQQGIVATYKNRVETVSYGRPERPFPAARHREAPHWRPVSSGRPHTPASQHPQAALAADPRAKRRTTAAAVLIPRGSSGLRRRRPCGVPSRVRGSGRQRVADTARAPPGRGPCWPQGPLPSPPSPRA